MPTEREQELEVEVRELRSMLTNTVTKLGVAKFQLQQERGERERIERQLVAERLANAVDTEKGE